MALLEFVSYLYYKGLVDATKLHDDTDAGSAARLATQKYAYIAKYFGLDLGYRYKMNLRGTYSMRLTQDCLDLYLDLDRVSPAPAPAGLREKEFLSVVSGRDSGWLEIATTIMREIEDGTDATPEYIDFIKLDYDLDYIRSVHADVHNLVFPLAQAA